MRPRRPSDPKSVRRVAWLLVAITIFVTGYMAVREITYLGLAQRALRVEAEIFRIDVRHNGPRIVRTMSYRYEVGGKTYTFDDRSDPDRLEELHTATFNAFTREKPAFVEGTKIGLLVDPAAPQQHRPDRARLELPWLIWLRGVLAVLFLSCVSAFSIWVSRDESRDARGLRGKRGDRMSSSTPPAGSPKTAVRTTSSNGTLSIEADLDVPWPERVAGTPAAVASRSTHAHVSSVRASITLNALESAVIEEARIELRTRIGGVEAYTLARAQRVELGDHARLSGQWTAPVDVTRVRILLTLADGRHWSHEVPVS